MNIPYSTEPRPSTGLTNARLGMMLFLASEVMLFGGLMTSYVFLHESYPGWERLGALADQSRALVPLALISASSVMMALAARPGGNVHGKMLLLPAALLSGTIFVVLTLTGLRSALLDGIQPSTSTYAGIWFVLTGLHAAHVICGLIALVLLLGPWRASGPAGPSGFGVRLGAVALYWHFLAVTWVVTAFALTAA